MKNQFSTQSFLPKAYSRTKWIIDSFVQQSRNYGIQIAIPSLSWWVGNYSRISFFSYWGLKKLTQELDEYFENKYGSIIKELNDSKSSDFSNKDKKVETYNIWWFWWQGEKNAPTLVKSCLNRLRLHNENVIILSKNNINKYVDIPDEIYQKVDKGIISYTHFSDILRVSLLAEKGGMWIDATCFVPYTIPKEVSHENFYSPSTKNIQSLPMWSNSRWCGWNLGTNIQQNPLFIFCRDMLYAINKNEQCLPHYLILDYLIDYAYRKNQQVQQMISNQVEYNTKRNQLHFLLNSEFGEKIYSDLIKHDWMFKLSYKTPWKRTVNGNPTFYGKLLDEQL